MDRRKEAVPIFVEDAPEFEFRDGMFFSRVSVGNQEFVCVYKPHTFKVANSRANAVIFDFNTRNQGKIRAVK